MFGVEEQKAMIGHKLDQSIDQQIKVTI